MGKSTINGQFSIAMLVYRRVPFFLVRNMERCLFCWLVSKFGELGWSFVTTLILFLGSCWVFSDGRTSENISKHVLPSHNDEPYHTISQPYHCYCYCFIIFVTLLLSENSLGPRWKAQRFEWISTTIYIYMYHQYVQPYLKTIPETTLSHI